MNRDRRRRRPPSGEGGAPPQGARTGAVEPRASSRVTSSSTTGGPTTLTSDLPPPCQRPSRPRSRAGSSRRTILPTSPSTAPSIPTRGASTDVSTASRGRPTRISASRPVSTSRRRSSQARGGASRRRCASRRTVRGHRARREHRSYQPIEQGCGSRAACSRSSSVPPSGLHRHEVEPGPARHRPSSAARGAAPGELLISITTLDRGWPGGWAARAPRAEARSGHGAEQPGSRRRPRRADDPWPQRRELERILEAAAGAGAAAPTTSCCG